MQKERTDVMVKTKATKEETLAKFQAARERKRVCLAKLEKSMREAYKNVPVRKLILFCIMKQLLSLKRINENSSYPVETAGEDGFYQFFTDGGVHYSVGFMEDDILLSRNSYQLIIANINNHKSPRDRKVRDTIIAIVDEFFRNNNSTLLYICETGDSRQSMRNRLFEYWFSTYNRKALFTMISSSIVDEEGVVNFATIILRNDNPDLTEIIAEFTESIQLLSQKPE